MSSDFKALKISEQEAKKIAKKFYGIEGDLGLLPGDSDFNFKIKTKNKTYILKISRPSVKLNYLKYQDDLLRYLNLKENQIELPAIIPDIHGNSLIQYTDSAGHKRLVRLLNWIEGRMWSEVNPITVSLLKGLGNTAGKITRHLSGFQHEFAHQYFEWDLAQSLWVKKHINVFTSGEAELVNYFISRFEKIKVNYDNMRKSIVHMDANDHNIVVSGDYKNPQVKSIIDFGDALLTQTINDLAITLAYALMDQEDPLAAAVHVIGSYHAEYPIEEKELEVLYTLIAMRLVISVTKSTLNSKLEPENPYHQISRKPAWRLLKKWRSIHPALAWFSFRKACEMQVHPDSGNFKAWCDDQLLSLQDLFPQLSGRKAIPIDLSLQSPFLGHRKDFEDLELLSFKMDRLSRASDKAILFGGYKEIRPFYTTDAFQKQGNNGPEYRTAHLGVDYWVPSGTRVHALFDGVVFSLFNNNHYKDYGPTLILQHQTDNGVPFYTLYGHLAEKSLMLFNKGQQIRKGELIAYIGEPAENGSWVPHLHFQIMLDMLHYENDFPGVAFPNELDIWSAICPDPNFLFKLQTPDQTAEDSIAEILNYRKQHLGKSLSLSYKDPLHIVRGEGVFLIDNLGRKYLDTVNNVAHVGHENYQVILAARSQMDILNTNTRYLNQKINEFTKELLQTLPEQLCVVHLVNSGSEANELALRMANAYTGQKDIIAIEQGYHGNTNACINISSYKFDGKGGTGSPEYTHIVPLPDSFRGIYKGKNTGTKYAAHIDQQLANIQNKGRNIAAFMAETIISCGGQIELPNNYLKQAYQSVRAAGGVCIADEVQHGCGRTGSHFWAFQMHDVVPDIVTIGKPIGNGHPLGIVVCTRPVAEAFANGMEFFNTFGGNPVSSAIGLEVLKEIRTLKLQENAKRVGGLLKTELRSLMSEYPIIGDVRGQGLFLGIELVDKNNKPLKSQASYLVNRMKEMGILMSTDGKDENVIKIKPPMVFSEDHARQLVSALQKVLKEDYLDITRL